jgi:putative heme-binding domain-containing protein
MRIALVGLFLLGVGTVAADRPQLPAEPPEPPFIATTGPKTPQEELKCFRVPPGFEVQLVAAEPYVIKPININFDDRGRLWVTESVEYPFPAPPGKKSRDAVKIYQWRRNGGPATEVTTFTDDLNIPIGVLPVRRGAIVYSLGHVYRLDDRNGDDRADGRTVLLGGEIGHRDTHGMTGEFTWGFDGWVYACHGYANDSTVTGSDGSKIQMNSGNVYRFKQDGSHVEQYTHGQVNPFGLTFDPLGNLYSCDCHTKPIMMLLRGGYYDSFGKPHDGLGYAPEMMSHMHGSTAIAGITYYAADQFPPEYQGTVFVGNVVTACINHDTLERHGSSYQAIRQPNFLVSSDPWFRPVDVKLGPDGALYVADFYNRIIGHYEVPLNHPGRDHTRGRIWRIVWKGTDGKAKPPVQPRADWGKASVGELVHDLGHPNLVVRMKAMNQLVERGGQEGVRTVRKLFADEGRPAVGGVGGVGRPAPSAGGVGGVGRPAPSAYQQMHALWVLERRHVLDDGLGERAAHDDEPGVRTHLMRILSERPQLLPAMHQLVVAGLKDADPFVRRAAADALGTHPDVANLRPLLDLRRAVPADDTHLLYVVRWAIRNQIQGVEDWSKLPIGGAPTDAADIADIAPGVHNAASAAFLVHYLAHHDDSPENVLRYVGHVARYGDAARVDQLLKVIRPGQKDLGFQLALFKDVQHGTEAQGQPLIPAARTWAEELVRQLLTSGQEAEVMGGIELCGTLKMAAARKALAAVVGRKRAPETQRAAAMAALVSIDPATTVSLLGRLVNDASEAQPVREKAVQVLGGINQPAAQEELARSLLVAPSGLAVTIAAALAGNHTGAEKLLAAVAVGKASARLLQERQVQVNLTRANLPDLTQRLEKLTAGLPPADAKVQELMKRRHAGFEVAKKDASAGAKVYEQRCAICHRIGGKGAKVGPQLDGIGVRGLDRLLEDVLDPNRNVDQAFRATTLNLTNGQTVFGLLLREEGAVLVMADNQGKEVRVPKKSVDERATSQLSPMPANFAEQIPEPEFYNLMAYLLSQRPSKEQETRITPGPRSR